MRNLHLFSALVRRDQRARLSGHWKFIRLALLISGTTLPFLWFLWNRKARNSDLPSNTSTDSISQPHGFLCLLCRSVSLTEMRGPNHDRMQPHQPSYLALKKAVREGCQLCSFIWTALERFHTLDTVSGEVSDGRLALRHVSDQYPGRQISLVAWGKDTDSWVDQILITTTGEVPDLEDGQEGASDISDPTMHPDHQIALSGVLDLFTYPDDPASWHGKVRGRPLPKTSGNSDEDFELAKAWLDDCLCNHSCCRKSILQETRLPTRVLDVGPADGSEEPYLLESCGMYGCYITLSHCWGGHVPLTTTSDTISERKRRISLTSLPKTFHDAVLISRKFGVQYLWIDSLCIIQDSTSDWEKESAMMGDVYGRSYLTVAARGAANAEIGCFIERKEEPPACRLEYRSPDDLIKGQMFVRDPTFQIERVDQSPLDQRGWVLQERILPPRILYYGSQQLYWECTSTTIRQDGKFRDIGDIDGYHGLRSFSGFKQVWDPDAPSQCIFRSYEAERFAELNGIRAEVLELTRRWYLIIEQYTCRKLTFASDRLPAIAGVAKKFHQKTGYSYVAGLWKEDLLSGLLWQRIDAKDTPTSPKLPTWSWARFSGKVALRTSPDSSLRFLDTPCELIDLSYDTTDNLYNYGEISNARIQIKGPVVRVILKTTKGSNNDVTLYTTGGAIVGQPNFDILESQKVGFEYFCLLVNQGYGVSSGLVLELVEGQTTEYRRVGLVSIPSDLEGHDFPDGRTAFSNIDPQMLTIV